MIAPRSTISTSGRIGKTRVGVYGSLAVLLMSSRSFAQAEAQKPAPNVLLLVDSSGSMEFKTDGTFPHCTPGNSATSEKSRWIDLVEVLTGSFQNYSCLTEDRSTAAFRDEFSLGGLPPYDYGYVNPYHRALSNSCTYGPGVLPPAATPYAWPSKAVNTFPVVGSAVSRPGTASLPTYGGCSDFSQASDGLLDVYKDMVRFGLMTFDARVSSGTGLNSGSADYSTGFDGNWSYYLGSATTGHPANCTIPNLAQEVGARNAAAPPWEGRMVAFGPPNETDNSVRNGWIQDVLLSTRPYGATPIAGQLDDARQFLLHDTTSDPFNAGQEFGPSNDPNWRASNCRKSILILLTDGEPNLDLRPFCEATPDPGGTPGHCPYDKPEDIVASLKDAAPQASMSVETYVVGFALGRVTPAGSPQISCSALTDAQCSDPLNNVPEQAASKSIQACCTLNKVAAAGGVDIHGDPRKAYFAENRADLKAIFTDILDDVIQVATRTMPVFSNAGGDTASKGYKFFSAFDPQPDPAAPQLWEGILERRRFVCTESLVPQLKYDPVDGDDFAANLNSQLGLERRFYTVIGDDSSKSMRSIRPYVTEDDGLGTAGGTQMKAERPGELAGLIPPAAMQVSTCAGGSSPGDCRDLIVQHLVGIPNSAGKTRCPASGCELFGGIFHSVPTPVSGRPGELLRDESYEAFAKEMGVFARPSVLYTSTVDGFLHAFNLAPFPGSEDAATHAIATKTNNELWSFIPPAVLPVLQTQYPSTPAVLLDGVPIIKDVVATKVGEDEDARVSAYERNSDDAQAGGGFWRSVLVQGFGSKVVGGGYFAIDVTEPDRSAEHGPTFRWQLTQDSSGHPLFGTGGTPLITTVFLEVEDGVRKEVPVAVLPGGDSVPSAGTGDAPGEAELIEHDHSEFKANRAGRNYAADDAARSLTIVRLDTGAVLRTFRPRSAQGSFATDVWTDTNIPAPITGQPKAFPETTGAVADRIYVGDRDGRLWRIDVSSEKSEDWDMQVMFDAFWDGSAVSSEPVVLPPVLSVDDVGDVTIAFATGSQELDNTQNRVISLTERLDDDNNYIAHLNWRHQLDVGDRVTGPMVLFNSGLYYAVSHPPATTNAACDVGSSKVYGSHYVESLDFQTATQNGTEPRPTTGPAKAPGGAALEITRQAGLVFGLSLEAEPTCVSDETAINGNDSFGYGEVRMSQTVNPGRYYLSFDASGNNTGTDARGVLEVRQQLDSPRLAVTFESWAAVYE